MPLGALPRLLLSMLVVGTLVGCSQDTDDTSATEADQPAATTTSDQEGDQGAAEADPASDQDDEARTGEDGTSTATIIFDDGETLSTDVFCALESQDAAGDGQLLFTITSLESPYFDLTVFGQDGEQVGATVSWDETEDFQTFEESWSAGHPAGTSDLTVARDGSTITASGTFTRNEDASGQSGETRQGTVEVVCR